MSRVSCKSRDPRSKVEIFVRRSMKNLIASSAFLGTSRSRRGLTGMLNSSSFRGTLSDDYDTLLQSRCPCFPCNLQTMLHSQDIDITAQLQTPEFFSFLLFFFIFSPSFFFSFFFPLFFILF